MSENSRVSKNEYWFIVADTFRYMSLEMLIMHKGEQEITGTQLSALAVLCIIMVKFPLCLTMYHILKMCV